MKKRLMMSFIAIGLLAPLAVVEAYRGGGGHGGGHFYGGGGHFSAPAYRGGAHPGFRGTPGYRPYYRAQRTYVHPRTTGRYYRYQPRTGYYSRRAYRSYSTRGTSRRVHASAQRTSPAHVSSLHAAAPRVQPSFSRWAPWMISGAGFMAMHHFFFRDHSFVNNGYFYNYPFYPYYYYNYPYFTDYFTLLWFYSSLYSNLYPYDYGYYPDYYQGYVPVYTSTSGDSAKAVSYSKHKSIDEPVVEEAIRPYEATSSNRIERAQAKEKWVAAKNGDVPENAIIREYKGANPVYYCRGDYQHHLYYGTLVPKEGCYILDNEVATFRFNAYQVQLTK